MAQSQEHCRRRRCASSREAEIPAAVIIEAPVTNRRSVAISHREVILRRAQGLRGTVRRCASPVHSRRPRAAAQASYALRSGAAALHPSREVPHAGLAAVPDDKTLGCSPPAPSSRRVLKLFIHPFLEGFKILLTMQKSANQLRARF